MREAVFSQQRDFVEVVLTYSPLVQASLITGICDSRYVLLQNALSKNWEMKSHTACSRFCPDQPARWRWSFHCHQGIGKLLTSSNDTRDIIRVAMDALDRIWVDGHRYMKAGVMLGASTAREWHSLTCLTNISRRRIAKPWCGWLMGSTRAVRPVFFCRSGYSKVRVYEARYAFTCLYHKGFLPAAGVLIISNFTCGGVELFKNLIMSNRVTQSLFCFLPLPCLIHWFDRHACWQDIRRAKVGKD